jgi:polyferredoxin
MAQLIDNPTSPEKSKEAYRDSLSTVDQSGKRLWVYPKSPAGKWHRARVAVAVLLLAVLFGTPFVKIGGQPLFLFNLFDRQFVILGQPFFPQDFHLLGLAMLIFFVFISLFTVVFGRVWCGWACPQTIFMEMVFRKIEYWIEGDANQQRTLDKAPWDARKITKKMAKHAFFLLFSAVIAHLVMAYLIGVDGVRNSITQSPSNNLSGFIGLVSFTGIFYFVFAKLREQVCTVVCPYGRLQSVLLNRESMIVAYDEDRGEPRGKLKKEKKADHACTGMCGGCSHKKLHADRLGTAADAQTVPLKLEDFLPKGDCIDCKLCVQVCPTGIDIRNGLQMECVNCMACIDACNSVMQKIGKPEGLIRIDSQKGMKEKKPFRITSRIAAYSVVLLLLLTLQSYLLISRQAVEATVLRVPGMMYQERTPGKISNLYNAQFTNKTHEDMQVKLKLRDQEMYQGASIQVVGGQLSLAKGKTTEAVFFIELPKDRIQQAKTPLIIELYKQQGDLLETVKTNFLGPAH